MTKAWALAVVLVGCGDDGASDGGDGGVVVTRGTVTVVTHPGLRIDFMSAATNEVIERVTADANGKAEAEIDYGDRAVIVTANEVRILDQLEPTKEYRDRWYLDGLYSIQGDTDVTVTWTAPASATDYRVSSLCGGTRDVFTATSTTVTLCNAGDGILVTAYDSSYAVIGSAYQTVAAPSGAITITAPFSAHRDVALTLARTPTTDVADLSTTLVTAEGALLSDSPSVSSSSLTVTAKLPAIDGTLRTFAQVGTPGVGTRWLIDRRPVADAITLDMEAVDLPYITSLATASAGSTVQWNQSGSGTPTLVVIGWNGPNETSYRLVTRYTGTSAVLPVLPPDVTATPMPSLGAFAMVVACPAGYEAAIEGLARQRDPLMSDMTLYFSTYL